MLAEKVKRLAGVAPSGLPVAWRDAAVTCTVWLTEYDRETIILGVRLTMARRRAKGQLESPLTPMYFQPEIATQPRKQAGLLNPRVP
jgi:hypothetical protein